MATRSFLLDSDLDEARARLAGVAFPEGAAAGRAAFSAWLGERLLARLRAIGDFDALGPVIYGSWARGELSPKSDIDVLFTGEEALVAAFTARALELGLTLRARVPEDPRDWAVGVEPFDLLALADARRIDGTPCARPPRAAERAGILREVRRERELRRRRQDSVTNYLEPNLKFGAGGLRDVGQALSLRRLYGERMIAGEEYPFEILRAIKDQLLVLRAHVHLNGSGDIFTAADQLDLAARLGLGHRELTRFVQSQLERASFYADWVVDRCGRRDAGGVEPFASPARVIARLGEKPDLATQFEVRRAGRALFRRLSVLERGKLLRRALDAGDDDFVVALHRTRLLEQMLPEFKEVRGLVQHDHYHRYTADAHLTQALRETKRAARRPMALGPLGKIAKAFGDREWTTLQLTALFHDLAKGRGGDHSVEGARLADERLRAWEVPSAQREDVVFLVENHLVLSHAAFRQNPGAQATWRGLFDRGVTGRRLDLLTVFTAIDIRATNPDAWTAWKAHLLADLNQKMKSPNALGLRQLLSAAPSLGTEIAALDPALLAALPARVLARDLAAARGAAGDLPVLVQRVGGKTWVRFHRREDRSGLFHEFVRHLFGFGLNVQMCFVHTTPELGAYDWFCIKGDRPTAQIRAWLALPPREVASPKGVIFQSVELTARHRGEWTFSARGRDQRGLLLTAAQALADLGLSLRWARVHTWGQQVEDVFGVEPLGESDARLAGLKARLTNAD